MPIDLYNPWPVTYCIQCPVGKFCNSVTWTVKAPFLRRRSRWIFLSWKMNPSRPCFFAESTCPGKSLWKLWIVLMICQMYRVNKKSIETHWTQHSKTQMFVLGPGSGIPCAPRDWIYLILSNQSGKGNLFPRPCCGFGMFWVGWSRKLSKVYEKVFLAIWKKWVDILLDFFRDP